MKLKQFKERDNKRIGIIVFTICCIVLVMGVFFFRSFALFEEKKNFNVIHGTVTDPGDLYFAYYVDDEITFELPKKDSGYTLSSKSSCNNGVTVSWDYDNWSALVNYENYQKGNSSKTKCNLYFVPTASKYIEDLANTSEEIVDDETVDHNLRYVGANPNNYVSFNNELWRIIGVMNNVDDGTGKKESRIKLIRNDSIGNYSWDTSDSTVNSGYGINEWSKADLMKLLNPGYESESVGGSLYWNRNSGTCYYGISNATTACNFMDIGIAKEAKSFIGETLWNTGSNGDIPYDSIITSKFYELERSNNIGKICSEGELCNDMITRNVNWVGYIGLMFSSDYGYATNGNLDTNRNMCLSSNLFEWKNLKNCPANNWLYKSGYLQWTISPSQGSTNAGLAFDVGGLGNVGCRNVANVESIYPSLYLKSNVRITSGNGSQAEPFTLSL